MKLKVEKKFRDKYTEKLYQVGDVIEVSEERGEELLSDTRNIVAPVEEVAKKSKTRSTSKAKSKK